MSRLLGWFCVSAIGSCLLACSSSVVTAPGPYLMSETKHMVDDEWTSAGAGCQTVPGPGDGMSSSSTGQVVSTADGGLEVSDDFFLEEASENGVVTVKVSSGGSVVAERSYDIEFLESGDVDTFQVTTEDGELYELSYWGGPECEASEGAE